MQNTCNIEMWENVTEKNENNETTHQLMSMRMGRRSPTVNIQMG